MREIRLIVAYFFAVLLAGAILAPWLYWAGTGLGQLLHFEILVKTDFQRYFNRAFLIAAVALLWPLLVRLRINRASNLGLQKNPNRWRDLLLGFFIAGASVLPLWIVVFQFGIYEWKKEPFHWWPVLKAAQTALAVSVLEELFFRGGLMGLIMRNAKQTSALWFVAILFSIIHWLKPPTDSPISDVSWVSGFQLLPYCFWRFADLPLLIGGFLTLLIVGLMLGHARLATKSLWLPIGLHIGLIFGVKSITANAERLHNQTLPWLGPDLLIGLWPLCVVCGCAVTIWILLRKLYPSVACVSSQDRA